MQMSLSIFARLMRLVGRVKSVLSEIECARKHAETVIQVRPTAANDQSRTLAIFYPKLMTLQVVKLDMQSH